MNFKAKIDKLALHLAKDWAAIGVVDNGKVVALILLFTLKKIPERTINQTVSIYDYEDLCYTPSEEREALWPSI